MTRYEESTANNFSSLSALLQGVDYYNKYISERIEDKAMSFGSALHMYFLENNRFTETYAVLEDNKPSNIKHKEFCEKLSTMDNFSEENRVEAYRAIYSIKGKKEADLATQSSRLYMQFKTYIEFLKKAKNMLILDDGDFVKIKKVENRCRMHKGINYLLYSELPHLKCYSELEIFFNIKDMKFKSKIDRLVIDMEKKIVYHIDIKTHSTKSLRDDVRKTFKKSIEHYNLDMQQALYTVAIGHFMKNELDIKDFDSYDVRNMFILVQSNFLNTVKLIQLDNETLDQGAKKLREAIEIKKFHDSHEYLFDIEYYENDLGIERLK